MPRVLLTRTFGFRAPSTTTAATAATSLLFVRTSSSIFAPPSRTRQRLTTMAAQEQKNITIIGGGIIGCCTAYYLTRHPSYNPAIHKITLLEASNTNSGGRLPDDPLQDPASLLDDPSLNPYNPAHAGIAGGASGKAGGLLALWAFPQNIVPLSFKLHQELADEHNGAGRWGYRRCYAAQVECIARKPLGTISSSSSPSDETATTTTTTTTTGVKGLHKDHRRTSILESKGAPADLDWLSTDSLQSFDEMGQPSNTAQVHPELFTRRLAALAEEKGVKIMTGCQVTSINTTTTTSSSSEAGAAKVVESVSYTSSSTKEEETTNLPTTTCIVSAGPWTSNLLPQIPVTSSRAHSIVLRRTPPPDQFVSSSSPNHALFTSITMPSSRQTTKRAVVVVEPEIYPRPDGTVYACGGTTDSDVPLPSSSSNAGVQVDAEKCREIEGQVEGVLDEKFFFLVSSSGGKKEKKKKTVEVLARQACYLPQGGPFIGEVGGDGIGSGIGSGIVVAAGHTCWGIQNGPATGKLVSEVVFDGEAKSARL